MTLNIIKTLILYFLSLQYCFCCKNCRKNKDKINENNKLNNNDDNSNNNNNDDKNENVEIIKNDDVYVKKFINRVNGEIARKMYIFVNTFNSKKYENNFLTKDDPELKEDYFYNHFLEFYSIGGNIIYALFDKKTDDIICLLSIDEKGNKKIKINNIEIQPEKTIYINTFQCHYKYRNKGYGKILMLYVLQQFTKDTGFYLAVNGTKAVMTNKKLSEVYEKFGFKLSFCNKLDKDDDKYDGIIMAFIKNDNKTYYKNKPVKVIIEER